MKRRRFVLFSILKSSLQSFVFSDLIFLFFFFVKKAQNEVELVRGAAYLYPFSTNGIHVEQTQHHSHRNKA